MSHEIRLRQLNSILLPRQVLYSARDHALDLVGQFESKRLKIAYVDVGGSFGIPYDDAQTPLNLPVVIDRIVTPFLNKGSFGRRAFSRAD